MAYIFRFGNKEASLDSVYCFNLRVDNLANRHINW